MQTVTNYDAVIVGSGPNGLAAAIALAQKGAKTLIIEGKETLGGGVRSAELTLPNYVHDICSAIHPMTAASPFLSTLPLEQHGLSWVEPEVELAHPFDGGDALINWRSVAQTAAQMGADEGAYQRLYTWLSDNHAALFEDLLGALPIPPRHPFLMAWFGLKALLPATLFAKLAFKNDRARAHFAGMAAHAILPLHLPATSAFGMMLGLTTHAVGWVFPRGGAQKITDALVSYYRSLGGELVTGQMVASLDELPPARATFLDITPRQFLQIAGDKLPSFYRRQLENYRYGEGVFKMDFALDAPIPWANADVGKAATVHLGGSFDEIVQAEYQVGNGKHPERPFVLLAQHTVADSTRAPQGKHTAWAYCHVPNGSTVDMSAQIEGQIERFAPGFRDLILAKASMNTTAMQSYNPNYIGGDINGGMQDLFQLFTRPAPRLNPYSTPLKNVYLCSSATPPGGGVHGMSGYQAVRSSKLFR